MATLLLDLPEPALCGILQALGPDKRARSSLRSSCHQLLAICDAALMRVRTTHSAVRSARPYGLPPSAWHTLSVRFPGARCICLPDLKLDKLLQHLTALPDASWSSITEVRVDHGDDPGLVMQLVRLSPNLQQAALGSCYGSRQDLALPLLALALAQMPPSLTSLQLCLGKDPEEAARTENLPDVEWQPGPSHDQDIASISEACQQLRNLRSLDLTVMGEQGSAGAAGLLLPAALPSLTRLKVSADKHNALIPLGAPAEGLLELNPGATGGGGGGPTALGMLLSATAPFQGLTRLVLVEKRWVTGRQQEACGAQSAACKLMLMRDAVLDSCL